MTISRNLSFLAEGVFSTGVLGVSNGGSGASTLTGYLYGNGTSAFTASTTIPTTALSGTISNAQLANSSLTVNGTSISLGGSGTVTAAAGTLTGTTLNSTVVSSNLTSVGTLTSGTWNASTIGAIYGGTGQNTVTTGDLLYGSASNTWSKLGIGSTGTILRVVGGVPTWGTDYTGTVTSVAALTLGTTGTDLSSTVANGTTTPVITLNVPTASATNRGVLSSADWTTFNNKGSGSVTSVAASVPSFLSISGSPITTSGTLAITYSGTALPVANGGTGLTSLTAGYIPYGNGTGAFSNGSSLQYTSNGNGFSLAVANGGVWSEYTYQSSINLGNSGYGTFTARGGTTLFGSNFYVNSGGSYSYKNTDYASFLQFTNGQIQFLTGPSGTAGTSISASQPMTIDNSGNVLIGTTSTPFPKLYTSDGTVGVGLGPYSAGSIAYIGTWTNHAVGFATNGAEVMRLFTSKGVSIGNTTDPGASNLSVNGVIKIGSNQAVNGPAFSAYPSSNSTTFAAGVFTKMTMDLTEYNVNSNFASSRFTPTVAGYYQINGQINFNTATGTMIACIFKNGSRYRDGTWLLASASQSLAVVSAVIYFNGSTDYVELYGGNGNATSVTNVNTGVPQGCVFNGVMVRGA